MDDILSLCQNPDAVRNVRAHRQRVAALLDRGVSIPCPESVEIGPDVSVERIAPGVVLHTGSRLRGARTCLGTGVEIGREGPASLEDVVCGPGVCLDGGSFVGATFLDGAGVRSWAHVRAGTLFEEHASAAHCVGLKQTLLFPHVTLGSLINFCDVLMAGGTGPRDHSEVGSGYIHFNFTPRGDKATPSIFGDVPRGVLLREPRIFLGGLAASVGPMQVGYGSFLGPGEVYRRDVKEGKFQLGERRAQLSLDVDLRILTGLRAKIRKNLAFVGNLVALWRWYREARPLLVGGDPWRRLSFEAGQETVEEAVAERIRQLDKLVGLVPESIDALKAAGAEGQAAEQAALATRWPAAREVVAGYRDIAGDRPAAEVALDALAGRADQPYVDAVRGLPAVAQAAVTTWLRSVASTLEAEAGAALG